MSLCEEKHSRIDEKFTVNEKRLNNHSERIDNLEQFRYSTEVEMKNLIKQIGDLVSVIKWSMGLLITTMVGFFIWYIQML